MWGISAKEWAIKNGSRRVQALLDKLGENPAEEMTGQESHNADSPVASNHHEEKQDEEVDEDEEDVGEEELLEDRDENEDQDEYESEAEYDYPDDSDEDGDEPYTDKRIFYNNISCDTCVRPLQTDCNAFLCTQCPPHGWIICEDCVAEKRACLDEAHAESARSRVKISARTLRQVEEATDSFEWAIYLRQGMRYPINLPWQTLEVI